MHFMASPDGFRRRPNERIHFTKHFSGSALDLLQSHSRHKCRTSIVALEDPPQYGVFLCCIADPLFLVCTAAQSGYALLHAAFETTRANINVALAKAVWGVERWTYSWLSSVQRSFSRWRRCFWACRPCPG